MSDIDRFMGRFDEFQKWEDKQHESINQRLGSIERKVDSLRLWRASILGISSILGAIAGFLVSLFKA